MTRATRRTSGRPSPVLERSGAGAGFPPLRIATLQDSVPDRITERNSTADRNGDTNREGVLGYERALESGLEAESGLERAAGENTPGGDARIEHHERYAMERLGVGDLEVLRLILRGASVIDWRRLHFQTRDEVDQFLRLNLFDPDEPTDRARMFDILAQAVDYLRKTFRYKVAAPVAQPREIHDIFLIASGVAEPKRLRRIACVVLKVMHTVHHIEARELLSRTRLSEVELEHMVDARVREVLVKLSGEHGIPVVDFHGSAKSRASIITKLIAKKETLAAQVYDRLRYRIVVPRHEDLIPLVLVLSNELFPFNYVVPGQTQNTLVSFSRLLRTHPNGVELKAQLQELEGEDAIRAHEINEFSSRDYRILNFIVDLPMRIDATALATRKDRDEDFGRIVFAPVELQVVDAATQEANESGDSAHARYKRRQLRKVLSRLSRGLVVPRQSPLWKPSRKQ